MERIVYLLGTSHAYQGRYEIKKTVSKNDLIKFKKFLREICRAYEIKAICEELRPEYLDNRHKGISIPMEVASSLKDVKHEYCNPSQKQMEAMGIRHSGYFTQGIKLPKPLKLEDQKNLTQEEADDLEWQEDRKREPYWFCKIHDLNTWPTLFICGSKHVSTFSRLLETATFTVHTVDEKLEPIKNNSVPDHHPNACS
jgi:hypothetical protein